MLLHESVPYLDSWQVNSNCKKARLENFTLDLELAGNGEIIGASEGYKAKSGATNGSESVKKNAPDAIVVEV